MPILPVIFGATRSKHIARTASARRHAQAVFELGLEKNQLDTWRRELKMIDATLGDHAIMLALEAPKVSFEDKRQWLQEKLGGLSPAAANLVYFLVARGRLRILHLIVTEYESMVDAHNGIEHAEVTTPFPLDENECAILAERLARALGKKKVILEIRVDSAILGGIVARIGDKLIDGSTRTKLESLKRSLQSGAGIA